MYLKILVASVVLATMLWLVRTFRPTPLGIVWGLLFIYAPFSSQRLTFVSAPLLNGLTIAALILAVLSVRRESTSSPAARRMRVLLAAWVAVSGTALVTTLAAGSVGPDPLPVFKRWLDPILFAWLALCVARSEDRRFALTCLPIGYALVAVHAVHQGLDYGPTKRIPGLLGQPNETGAFLAMYAPMLLAITLTLAPRRYRPILLGVLAVAAAGLVPLESRGSMIAFAAGLIVVLVGSRNAALAALALVLGVAVFSAPNVLPERVTARFEATLEDSDPTDFDSARLVEALDPSTTARFQQWTAGGSAFLTNPLGFGFARFKHIIGAYGGVRGLDAHNFFVLVAVELGITGLILIVVLLFAVGAAGRHAYQHIDAAEKALGLGIIGMLVSTVIVNMVGSRLMQSGASLAFWSLAGMAASLHRVPIVVGAAVSGAGARLWWQR